MCTRTNLQLLFKFLNLFKIILFLFLLILGSIFAGDLNLQRVWGGKIAAHGGGLILIGVAVPISQYTGSRGSVQHNTFLLTIFVAFEALLLLMQFSIASDLLSMGTPEFSEDLRRDCMKMNPTSRDACKPYLSGVRYAGFRLVWAHDYTEAQADTTYYSKIDDLQKLGNCCGFGAPLSCVVSTEPPPSELFLKGVPESFSMYRQTCGKVIIECSRFSNTLSLI